MKKLFLIDAHGLIYRSYYAFIRSPRINSKGLNTSAIFGFVNTLEEVLKNEQPTHLAVVFDPEGKTFRHEAYEQYKAQREKTPEDIRKALPIIKELVAAYNIPAIEVTGYEADDVIGTLAKQAEKKGFEVYLLTSDKDLGQLVSDHIFMFRPHHNGGFEVLGPDQIKEKYQLENQQQVIDLLGLMGDSSDNIPGCPGIGEKTAVKLLQEFGSIDNLLQNTDKLKGSLKTKIEENKDLINFSRFLATIKTDVPVALDEEALKVGPADSEKLRALFQELEFRTLLNNKFGNTFSSFPPDYPLLQTTSGNKKSSKAEQMNLFGETNRPQKTEPEKEKILSKPEENIEEISPFASNGFMALKNIPHHYQLIDDKVKRSYLVSQLFLQKSVCFDTETTGLDVFSADLVGLSFCFREGEAYFVTLPDNREEATKILNEFKAFFVSEQIEKIGHNMKFDLLMLSNYGIDVKGKLFDTMIAHYLLQPELRHGMDYLAEIYLHYHTIHYEDLVGAKGKNQLDIRNVEISKLTEYAAEDADVTFRLKQILEKELATNELEKLFYEIEMPLMKVLVVMEKTGVRIDSEALRQSSEILTENMLKLEKEIYEMAGGEFNINSPVQVGEVLFDRLHLDDKAKKTKTGQYSTSEDVLEKLRHKHPIVDKILEYRGLKKLLSTYIDALPQLIHPKTGKIHTSYNQTNTATGRLSSSNPNLQNIPIRDELGKEIRKAFIPEENSLFLSADYSQIELRVMAHLSNDQNMIEAFRNGLDIHAATAAKIYKVPLEQVTSEMRRHAKTANFGIIYGISAFGLAERLGISRTEAKTLIDEYFLAYPQIKTYIESAIKKAKENGYVETLLGRKRFLPDINSQNSVVRGFAERNAVNAPIQGSAADIIKIAMVNIQRKLEKENLQAKMILQVHDELNFTVPVNELETVRELVVYEMEHAFPLNVPLIVDCGVGNNWLEAH
jgi:DNA polymerase-1